MNILNWEQVYSGNITYNGGEYNNYQYFSMPALANAFVNNKRLIIIFDYKNTTSNYVSLFGMHIGVAQSESANYRKELCYLTMNGSSSSIGPGEYVNIIMQISIINNMIVCNAYVDSSNVSVEITEYAYCSNLSGTIQYFFIGGRADAFQNISLKVYKQNAYNGIS